MAAPLDFRNKKIVVVGDAMTDEFVYGKITRKSPEADCDVFEIERTVVSPGGAANAARNIESLGAACYFFTGVEGVTKRRYVASGFHRLRVDEDRGQPVPIDLGILYDAISRADAVLLSDYAKGTLTDELVRQIIEAARLQLVPMVAAPKREWAKYKNASLRICNQKEYSAANYPSNTLVTCGKDGMFYGQHIIPAHDITAKEVAGAGDTAAAAVTLMLACGATVLEAAEVANAAAALAVAKPGVATVNIYELNRALGRKYARGFANGCFDMLHNGHRHFISECKQYCEHLTIGLNSDWSVRNLKGGGRPYMNDQVRRIRLIDVGVDEIIIHDEPERMIGELQPDIILRGYDQELTWNYLCVRISELPGYSTTHLLKTEEPTT